MSSLGLGIFSGGIANLSLGGVASSLPPLVAPDAAWDGTEGSGFAALPTDPERTTAKPACRLLTPPRQWFTDTILVGVDAWANDRGSLLNCGLGKVVFHFEGGAAEITAPTFQTFVDANGQPVTYFGWWARLKKPANQAGYGNLYVEAIPADPTMQRRVIGPHLFAPQSTQHDFQLEVAASPPEISGQRYQTVDAALDWLKTQSPANPRIQITEAGKYEMLGAGGASFTGMKGRVLIEATVPDVSIGRSDYTSDADAKIAHNAFPLHFRGRNLTIDMRYAIEVDGGLGSYGDGMHWLDGCNFTSTSPQGRFEHLRGGKIDFFGWRVDGFPWFTEVQISNLAGSLGKVNLARGCTLDSVSYDIASDTFCVVDCIVTDHSDVWWSTDHKALSVMYTGPEATATFERDGGADANGTTFTASWGANSATFEVGRDEDYYLGTRGDGYSVQDVVDWINSTLASLDSGWAANLSTPDDQTLYSDLADQRAARISTALNSSKSFGAQNVKNAELQLFIGYNRHSDFFQHGVGEMENVIIRGNRVAGEVQSLFIGPINEGMPRDMVIVNNVFDVSTAPHQYYDNSVLASQIGKTDVWTSHLVLAHNTWVNQGLIIRSDSANMDMLGYELIANNILRELRFVGQEDPDATIADNHIYGPSSAPDIATGTSEGGLVSTLFEDAENGDFRPAGPLLVAGARPILNFDIYRKPFSIPFATRGAISAEATEYSAGNGGGTGSSDPVGDLLALLNTAGSQSSFHDYTIASDGSPWISRDQSANNNDHSQSINSRKPMVDAGGATFDGNNDVLSQSIAGGNFTIAMAVTVNGETSGTFLSAGNNSVLVQYQEGSAGGHAGTVRIDGSTRGTRDDVFQSVNGAGEVVLVIEGVGLDGVTELQIGRASGSMNATVRRIAVLDEDALGSDLAAARALAAEAVAAT